MTNAMGVPVAGEKKAVTRSLDSGVAGLEPNAGDESEHDGTPVFGGGVLNSDARSKVRRRFAASVASNVFLASEMTMHLRSA